MSKVQICSVKEFVNSIKSICVQFGLVDYSLQSKVVYSLCIFKLVNNIDVDKDLIKSQTNYVCNNAERTVEELLQYVSDDRKNDFCVQISDFLENVDVEIDNDKNFLSQVFDCLKSEKIQRMKYEEFFTPQKIADLMAE
ncbi:MAG: hypothetical protein IJ077_02570, partial [Eubacterium sp.]|nr:hypothetical protein [Eubacterium sp.]